MKTVKGDHITIAGAARSGAAAAILLKKRGADVFVSDHSSIDSQIVELLEKHHIPFEQKKHTRKAFESDYLVVSPGVPSTTPLPRTYMESGKSVYSEVEAASWFSTSSIIAVTGTNGKTTVANWLAHTWKMANRNCVLGGNMGTAFSSFVDKTAPDQDVVLEVSSFQLDHVDRFRANIAIILNITPDHLDRYNNDFELYCQAKFRITRNQTPSDYFIYNYDDPVVREFASSLSALKESPQILAFSTKSEPDEGAFIRDNEIILSLNNHEEYLMQTDELSLAGKHNLKNGMATVLAARAFEIKNEYIRNSLQTFEGVEHRLENIRKIDGIRYVNDSKATNINAVWYALDSFNMPVVLILGGRDKGNNYLELEKQLREKVHTVICLGEATPKIKQQLTDIVPTILEAETMKNAVKLASKQAKKGEIVLLSPACSSFDMYENFEERGHKFRQAVLEL